MADPPWTYETGNSLPYPTMRLDEIKQLAVSRIAADDAVLWLWTINGHLRVASDVVDALGL